MNTHHHTQHRALRRAGRTDAAPRRTSYRITHIAQRTCIARVPFNMASASDADIACLQELIGDDSGDDENGFTLADVDAYVAQAAIPRDDELAKQRRATNATEKAARARALVPCQLMCASATCGSQTAELVA
jgi:hypothetical protein